MSLTIFKDALNQPKLFQWRGAIDKKTLSEWLNLKNLKIPVDIFDFYCKTGGGDLFEGETILGPFGDKDIGDDLEEMNKYHLSKRMPKKYLIFHIGLGISVLEVETSKYLVLDEEYNIQHSYKNFEEWYLLYLRDEYKSRYGFK